MKIEGNKKGLKDLKQRTKDAPVCRQNGCLSRKTLKHV
jgi:hypothetical protein